MGQISVSVFLSAREIPELEAEFRERDRSDLATTIRNKLSQDISVPLENSVGGSYENIFLTLNPVVPPCTTLIVTEFFVRPADDTLTALCALAFHSAIKIIRSVRLPTRDQGNWTRRASGFI